MTDTPESAPPEVAKHPGGRPTLYRPEYCAMVEEFGANGKSRAYIAAMLGVARETLTNWERANPEFLGSMTRAKLLEQVWWEDAGQRGIFTPAFSASAWSRSMAARFPDDWRESKSLEHTGRGGGPIETTTNVREQIASRIAGIATSIGSGGDNQQPE